VVMLGQHARVVELFGVVDRRQPVHHLQFAHLLQRAKLGVTESLVPPPSFIVLMHRETECHRHLQLQPVHMIIGPLHPDEETSLPIPNLQYTTFDQHTQATLVHLPDADDRISQVYDPVHARQHLVLTAAPEKMMVPLLRMLTRL
jgi:hypothetical protein